MEDATERGNKERRVAEVLADGDQSRVPLHSLEDRLQDVENAITKILKRNVEQSTAFAQLTAMVKQLAMPAGLLVDVPADIPHVSGNYPQPEETES